MCQSLASSFLYRIYTVYPVLVACPPSNTCRNEFDADRVPELTEELLIQDIHSISSLLKMYFRDLPNPLFTYQLYDKFVVSVLVVTFICIEI